MKFRLFQVYVKLTPFDNMYVGFCHDHNQLHYIKDKKCYLRQFYTLNSYQMMYDEKHVILVTLTTLHVLYMDIN